MVVNFLEEALVLFESVEAVVEGVESFEDGEGCGAEGYD